MTTEIIMKRMIDSKEDSEFVKRTEEAYQRHELEESITMDSGEFLKVMKKW